jgi:N,N'-diacetyllegionaminate synthase
MNTSKINSDSKVIPQISGPLIIAELGSVHDGSFGNACKLIEAAAAAGADAVKFQTHIAEAETLEDAPSPNYFNAESRFEYFKRTGFTELQWIELKNKCTNCGVKFLSSPFSIEAVDLLEKIGVDLYKIPSGEVTNTPLLERIALTGKTVLLSSGMSDFYELENAIKILEKNNDLVVMQCTSEYPCPPEKVGLNVLNELSVRYNYPIGFSDHTLGCAASFAAAALGAIVIEKHFTFSKLMYGSDAAHSMEPSEFADFTKGLKDIWKMLKSPVDKNDIENFREMKKIFQKSIVTAKILNKGDILKYEDLAFKKPGDGIPASDWPSLIGCKISRQLGLNHKLSKDDLE